MEAWSVHHLFDEAKAHLGLEVAYELQNYSLQLQHRNLPVIFSLAHLAKIVDVDYQILHDTVGRKREAANYRMFAIKKRSGGRRFIHAVCGNLERVQKFVNLQILQKTTPSPCSYAFHSSGGIKKCASVHCGAKWLFQFDLDNFFHYVTEADVYRVFSNLGYKSLLSFELSRICTTIRLPKHLNRLLYRYSFNDGNNYPYRRRGASGVLPQGASTSPMLSNLAARELDESLNMYAMENGFVYTRYADDLAFSASTLPKGKSLGRIRSEVVHIIRKCKYKENSKKIRIAGPGARKRILGLLVDGNEPRISREMYRRIERHLYAIGKFGLESVALHEGFDSTYGFYNHLSGLITFVKDVDVKRWNEFNQSFERFPHPLKEF